MGIERRRHRRLKVEVPLSIASGHQLVSATTGDMSVSGVFILTKAKIQTGTQVQMRLKLGFSSLTVHGEVRWTKCDEDGQRIGVGVELLPMSAQAERILGRFLDEQEAASERRPVPRPRPRPQIGAH